MKITVIGVGYVGLVSAVGLAELGNDVRCLVRDPQKLRRLNRGQPIIYEPGLKELLQNNIREGRLSFTLSRAQAIKSASVIVIAVGTPQGNDGRADLSAVWSVGRDIGRHLNNRKMIITKSTVPVGTGDRLRQVIRKAQGQRRMPFDLVSNPEFLREGAAVGDFLNPDRIIVGVENARTRALIDELYRPITKSEHPILFTTIRSAELIKYASNCFLATKISFINELANFCEGVAADVTEIAKGMGLDSRIGGRFLHAGIGYGGSCFPKDVSALIATAQDRGFRFEIIEAAKRVNESQREKVIHKLEEFYPKLSGETFAVWGLSFKPQTDDVRESPALWVIRQITAQGGRIRAFDPAAIHTARRALGSSRRIRYLSDPYLALTNASALLILTEWDEFRQPDFARMKKLMKRRIIIDGRNIYHPKVIRQRGFKYASIGRK